MSAPTHPDVPPPLPGKPDQWAFPTDAKGEPKKKYVLWVVIGAAGCFASIVVLGVLATLIVPRIVQKYFSAAREMTSAQLQDLRAALEVYAETHRGAYPDALEALVTPDADGHTILRDERELPRDAWQRAFVYEPPTPERPQPRLYSLGRDGRPGGSGIDEDLHADPSAAKDR
jgi:general secretion pathway protein G